MNMNDAFIGSLIFNKNGGGGTIPTKFWNGTLAQYQALVNKSDDTVYYCYAIGYIGTTAVYVGEQKIYPVNEDPMNYELYMENCQVGPYNFDTGIHWFNGNDFELTWVFAYSSYGGTEVLFGNNNDSGHNFNMIMIGTQLRIYGLGTDQYIIDTIVPNVTYKVIRKGESIYIYREDTLLETRTVDFTSATDTLHVFNWYNSYYTGGLIKSFTFKFT